MKRIYIAGCGGMLGEAFYAQFRDCYKLKCTDIDLNSDWLSYLDFREEEAYRQDVRDFNPDFLFHLGAYTDLEFCERNPDETYRTNTLAVENAVNIANELNIPLLYISTAGIFDGKKNVYDDWDEANPIGLYARSKYMGEKFVIEHARDYLVCRAGWMIGGGQKKDKKFVGKLLKQIESGKTELTVVNDTQGSITYTHDFARSVKILLEKEYWGIYNMACEGFATRYDIATEMIKLLNLQDQVKINPVSSDYFSKVYFTERPPNERIENRKLNIRGISEMRHWSIALKDYLENHYYNCF